MLVIKVSFSTISSVHIDIKNPLNMCIIVTHIYGFTNKGKIYSFLFSLLRDNFIGVYWMCKGKATQTHFKEMLLLLKTVRKVSWYEADIKSFLDWK